MLAFAGTTENCPTKSNWLTPGSSESEKLRAYQQVAQDITPQQPLSRSGRTAPLPAWYPAWVRELADLYFSGTTCLFLLHGNVHDFIRCSDDTEGNNDTYATLGEFLGYHHARGGSIRELTGVAGGDDSVIAYRFEAAQPFQRGVGSIAFIDTPCTVLQSSSVTTRSWVTSTSRRVR